MNPKNQIKRGEKIYILLDGRAHFDEERAEVLICADSEKEARSYNEDFPEDSLWFEYDLVNNKAINGIARYDLRGVH